MNKIFLIGIGGSGLSAIARLLLESGYAVMGSDQTHSPILDELENLGARVFIGHRPEQVLGADLVIRSSAIPENNPELLFARQKGIPVQKRAEFLGDYLKEKITVAIAGTHGKTTTTAMLAWILTCLGYDPSYLVGGIARNLESNAHAGKSKLFVIEADEYDYMFLGLQPYLAVITNVEHDHPDLFPLPEDYFAAFDQFVSRLQPDGILLTGQNVQTRLKDIQSSRRTVDFGFDPTHNYQAVNLELLSNGCYRFQARRNSPASAKILGQIALMVPGKHNVLNALAAIACVDLLDCSTQDAAIALQQYSGVERRFEIRSEQQGIIFIDDYAHHPTEIRSTLQAAKDRFPDKRIIAVWQPHTFTRSKTLLSDFTTAFGDAQEVLITEVYAAREKDNSFSAEQLCSQMQHQNCRFFAHLHQTRDYLADSLRQDDVLIVLSAGDAISINDDLIAYFETKESSTNTHAGKNPGSKAG